MTWPCYRCGGTFCGHCVFLHADVGNVTVEQVDNEHVLADELAEGLHANAWKFWQRVASELAADPAGPGTSTTVRFWKTCG